MENQVVNNSEEMEIDLGEVFHLLISKIGIIILSAIILGMAAIGGTILFITPQYQSTTKIVVLNQQERETLTSQDLQTSTLLTKDYVELIKSRTVTEGVIAQLDLDLTHEKLLKKMDVSSVSDTRIISISVKDADPYKAREIANAVREMASAHIREVMDVDAVNVVDEANIPTEKVSPSIKKNGVLGGLLGGIFAVAVIMLVYFTNDTIRTPEDVEKYLGLSVLGDIPLMDMEKKSRKRKNKKR